MAKSLLKSLVRKNQPRHVKPKPKTAVKPAPTGPYGNDPLWGQSEKAIKYLSDPLLASLAADRRSEEGAASRQSVAAHAAMLAAYQRAQPELRDIHNRAIASQTATEAALGQSLRGTASHAGEGLTAALAGINAGAPNGAPLDTTYRGAENAGLAVGLTDVTRQRARGAAAEEFLAKGPGMATAQSQTTLAKRMGEIGTEYTKNKSDVLKQIPEKVMGEYKSQVARLDARMAAAQENALKERLTLQALGDKKALALFDAQQRTANITLRAQYAQELAGINAGYKADAAALKPGAKPKVPQWKAEKPARAKAAVDKALFIQRGETRRRRDTGEDPEDPEDDIVREISLGSPGDLREIVGHSQTPGLQAVAIINQALRSAKVNPSSPLGIQVRTEAMKRAGFKVGPRGNPSVPGKRKQKRSGT